MTEADVAKLERKLGKWSGKASMLVLPTIFVALLTLPVVTVHQATLPPVMLVAPVMMMLAVLFATRAARNWENATRDRIATYYSVKYHRTRWRTVADAEGVVVGVSTFGDRLTLAFGNGIQETYERSLLTPID